MSAASIQPAETLQCDVAGTGRHQQRVVGERDDGARLPAAGDVGDAGPRHGEDLPAQQHLRDAQRVGAIAKVQCAYQRGNLRGTVPPVDDRSDFRARMATEIVAIREILLAATAVAIDDPSGEHIERFKSGRVALRVEQEGGFVGCQLEQALFEDAARIGTLGHGVPGDAVLALVAQDGPAGDIEASQARQRAVVEIQCEATDFPQCRRRDQRQVRDAGEVVDLQLAQQRRKVNVLAIAADVPAGSPLLDSGLVRDDGGNALAESQQHVAAACQQAAVADQHPSVRSSHHRFPCSIPGPCARTQL
jgi:hypothetical protein